MKFPFFEGSEKIALPPSQPLQLPVSQHGERIHPENYIASEELRNAVNIALLLGKPLLLTGEPGSGKTLLAFRMAWELGFTKPLVFETKSTSNAKELFYYYNSLARFHAAQFGIGGKNDKDAGDKKIDGIEYITYGALGEAIIRTRTEKDYAAYLPSTFKPGFQRRSIVLIDEIDKAPRDFPNDILNELENMYFRVPELNNFKIEANLSLAPITVITSNSEKSLPDAFLRRCIFHHVEFPGPEQLKKIVFGNLLKLEKEAPDNTFQIRKKLVQSSLELFLLLREPQHRLRKLPSTGELLLWIESLIKIFPDKNNPLLESDSDHIIGITLNVLFKHQADRDMAKNIIKAWIKSRQ